MDAGKSAIGKPNRATTGMGKGGPAKAATRKILLVLQMTIPVAWGLLAGLDEYGYYCGTCGQVLGRHDMNTQESGLKLVFETRQLVTHQPVPVGRPQTIEAYLKNGKNQNTCYTLSGSHVLRTRKSKIAFQNFLKVSPHIL